MIIKKMIDPKNNEYPMISPTHSLFVFGICILGLPHEFTMSFRPFLFLYSFFKNRIHYPNYLKFIVFSQLIIFE